MSVDSLQSIDLSQVSDQLLTLLTDPTSNLAAALMLYGVIGLLVLIMLVAGIVLLMGGPEDEVQVQAQEPQPAEADSGALPPVHDVKAATVSAPPTPRPRRSPVVLLGVATVLVLAVWVVSGFTMSADAVCLTCHATSVHAKAKQGEDPHRSSTCVACHESGGVVGRYFTDVPARVIHFVDGGAGLSLQADYGTVPSSACSACHASGIKGVTLNSASGVRMSHVEPLAAGAKCLDCHEPTVGVVSRRTVGMGSCLRCHDGVTATSECDTCHDKRTAVAARARSTSFAKVQVPDVKCGGCHNEKQECDSCHGMRMPHTLAFKSTVHARAGAVDFWYNGGRTCARCHTATRRPCTKCHTTLLGKGHGPSMAKDHQGAVAEACNSCHQVYANPSSRDFCGPLCHSAAAEQGSPR